MKLNSYFKIKAEETFFVLQPIVPQLVILGRCKREIVIQE